MAGSVVAGADPADPPNGTDRSPSRNVGALSCGTPRKGSSRAPSRC